MVKQLRCPKCFELDNREAYACEKTGCTLEGKVQLATELSIDSQNRPICSECQLPLTCFVCPVCGFPLYCEGDNITIPLSIVGSQGAGKSNYLSVLIQRIKGDMGKAYGCALYPLGGDATMSLYDREYHYPLFVQGICPESTHQEGLDPLAYSLVFSGEKSGGRTCNVTFYDACGTNFESEKRMAEHNRSLYHSRGILFLIDPSQFSGVGETFKLQGKPVLESDPVAVLARMIHTIRLGLGQKNMQKKIDIPLAVCISKMDTVEELLDLSSFVKNQSRHLLQPSLNRIDWDSCNLEVQSLLESWGASELLHQIRAQFTHSSFFACSALGGSPGERGQVHRLSPHRILDPFLWLLWRNDIITCR